MRRAVVVVMVGVLAGCGQHGDAQPRATPSVAASTTLAAAAGASLVRLALSDGSQGYLQQLDMRRMRIEQVVGPRDPTRPATPGAYYPGSPSPRFTRIPPDRVEQDCRTRFGSTLFSVVNFAFFEEYDASTRLSFPAKAHGAVLSGGSSPYGPVAAPSAAYYRGVTLGALVWTDQRAEVVRYDPATGAPLNKAPDGLISYAYRDHPARALNGDPPNRYQLVGVNGQYLLILTVEHATLEAAAEVLRTRGATGDILTFDGGVSTFLWQAAAGQLVSITNKDGALPHYLCIHAA